MEFNFKEELKDCYPDWRYVPLDGFKRPNEPEYNPKVGREVPGYNWQNKPYTLDEVCTKPKEAIGLHLGPETNTAAFDFDGPDSTKTFEHWFGFPIDSLPKTLQNTSGRQEHFQMFFKIPKKWHDKIKYKVLPPPTGENWGKVELRWGHGKQSVLLGNHPNNKRYNPNTGEDVDVEPGAGDGRGYYDFLEGHFPEQVHLAPLDQWFCHRWAEIVAPKVVISDRVKEKTGKSIDELSEEQLRNHNLARAKKGLKEWFINAKYYVEPKWREIGICLKQLGNDDWGDPDKFFDLWHEWSENDPREGKYDGYEACATKWEEMEIRDNGITFSSFIFWALEDGHLTKEDLTQEEKVAVEKLSKKDPVQEIAEIVDELYRLEKGKGFWNKKQYLRSRLGGRHIRKEDIQKRLFELFGDEYGLNIGESAERQHRSLASTIAAKDELRPQLPGFTLGGRDHVLVGQAGTGKTTLALAISYAVFTGCESLLDRTEGVPIEEQGATIYIGSDGGEGALGMIQSYINNLKLPNDAAWRANTTFIGANSETGETSWGLTIRSLTELVELLEAGNPNGAPYRLIVLDTLKTILDEADIDFGIGPMGTVMAILQAIASRYNCAVLWLHHNAKGKGSKDMGIDAAGGNGNIVQKANAVISLKKIRHSKYQDVVRCEVQKLRGEQSRDFDFTFDKDNGGFKVVPREELEERTDQILYQIWMRQDSGASTTDVWKGVKDGVEGTIRNQLTALKKQKLIKSRKNKWFLEVAGMKQLAVEASWAKDEIDEYLKAEGKSK